MIAQMEGDLITARLDLGHAVSEFRELGDDGRLGEALRARGFAEVFGGSLSDAEWFLGEADAAFKRVENPRGRAWVQQHLAWVSFLGGDHATSEIRLAAAIRSFEMLGDRGGVTWSRGLLAYVRHFVRRNADAEALATGVYEEARRFGDEWGAAMMLNLRASIRLWSGDIESARGLGDKALAGFRKIGDRFGMVQSLATLNRALVAAGRGDDADRGVEELLTLGDNFGQMSFPSMAAAGTSMHAGNGPAGGDACRPRPSTGSTRQASTSTRARWCWRSATCCPVRRKTPSPICSRSTSNRRRSRWRRARPPTPPSGIARRRSATCA